MAFDFSFGGGSSINPFDWSGYGSGSDFLPTSSGSSGALVTGTTPNSVNGSGSSDALNWAKFGKSIMDSLLGYQLQEDQISHGQTPSIGYGVNGSPTGQLVSQLTNGGNFITILIFVVIAIVVLRAISK